jgi:2-oxoglutarate dehydrogenase E2 component (dihydrolipoamide succinyltransferase)
VSKWLKAVGDVIEKDEPILEISTDKVDAEVPAPGAGVLLEIKTQEGETVEVGTVVAVIGDSAEVPSSGEVPSSKSQVPSPPVEESQPVVETPKTEPVVEVPQTAAATAATDSNPKSEIQNPKSVEVVMPQMGESITEGTVSKWLKAVGDTVEKDEPLLEISTDKVDAEVPSPSAGKLLEIRVAEGETVEVGAIVGLVGDSTGVPSSKSQVPSSKPETIVEEKASAATTSGVSLPAVEKREIEETEGRSYDYDRPEAVADAEAANGKTNGELSLEDLRRTKSSPLVRNIAKEHGIDITRIEGSGVSGRVTKKDILSFIETGAALRPQDLLVGKTAAPSVAQPVSAPPVSQTPAQAPKSEISIPKSAVGDRVEPMSVMRRKIAEHMTFSKQTSAHVTSVYEIDMTNVARFREKNKNEFQARYGTKLTFMPFIFQAVNQALRKFPVVNAQVSGDNIIYKGDINLGMAVALDWGLIVPVIKKADTLSLSGLALTANDLADRARTKKLMPDEVQGGTFTITNPGVFGGLFGTPIINQPQVAILCVGTIEKRAKVLTSPDGDDYLAIRQMAYFALTYDHRIVDGADGEKFLSFMKEYLETVQFSL